MVLPAPPHRADRLASPVPARRGRPDERQPHGSLRQPSPGRRGPGRPRPPGPPWPDALGEPLVDDDLIRTGLWTAKAAVTPCFSAAPRSRDYQEIEDAWPRPRHLARRPRHHLGLRPTRYARSAGSSPRASAAAARTTSMPGTAGPWT